MDMVWVLAPAFAGMDTTVGGVVGNAGSAAYAGMSFGNHDRAEGGVRTAEEVNMVYQADGVHCAAELLAGPEASLEDDGRSSQSRKPEGSPMATTGQGRVAANVLKTESGFDRESEISLMASEEGRLLNWKVAPLYSVLAEEKRIW